MALYLAVASAISCPGGRPCSGAGLLDSQGHGAGALAANDAPSGLLGLLCCGQLGASDPHPRAEGARFPPTARSLLAELSEESCFLSPVSLTVGFGSSPPVCDLPDWPVTGSPCVLLQLARSSGAFCAQVVIARSLQVVIDDVVLIPVPSLSLLTGLPALRRDAWGYFKHWWVVIQVVCSRCRFIVFGHRAFGAVLNKQTRLPQGSTHQPYLRFDLLTTWCKGWLALPPGAAAGGCSVSSSFLKPLGRTPWEAGLRDQTLVGRTESLWPPVGGQPDNLSDQTSASNCLPP